MKAFMVAGLVTMIGLPAANAAVITGVTATASSSLTGFDRGVGHLVDGSGTDFSTGDTSNQPDGTMWLNNGNGAYGGTADNSPSVTFNLGTQYALLGMTVWNYNEGTAPFTDRGIASADVYTSADGTVFTLLENVVLNQAPGTVTSFGQNVGLSGTAQYVRLSNLGQFVGDDSNFVGLSEVQFNGAPPVLESPVPEPASMMLMGTGLLGLLASRKRARS